MLHTIGELGLPGPVNEWTLRYIFPGGYIPTLSELTPNIEKNALKTTDIEILRIHYARTLRKWYENFMANIDRAIEIYDERFTRIWKFYLLGCEAGFLYSDLAVFQIQLGKTLVSAPITRDYLYPSNTPINNS